jgi:hypothetical protein
MTQSLEEQTNAKGSFSSWVALAACPPVIWEGTKFNSPQSSHSPICASSRDGGSVIRRAMKLKRVNHRE